MMPSQKLCDRLLGSYVLLSIFLMSCRLILASSINIFIDLLLDFILSWHFLHLIIHIFSLNSLWMVCMRDAMILSILFGESSLHDLVKDSVIDAGTIPLMIK